LANSSEPVPVTEQRTGMRKESLTADDGSAVEKVWRYRVIDSCASENTEAGYP
jgi:hypothetical protein